MPDSSSQIGQVADLVYPNGSILITAVSNVITCRVTFTGEVRIGWHNLGGLHSATPVPGRPNRRYRDSERTARTMIAMSTENIREHMPVVCSNGGQFGTVDRIEGSSIKLTKDDQGQHHWIPMGWVTRVDEHVHIDRPGDRAMREWSAMPLSGTAGSSMSDMSEPPSSTSSGMEGEEGIASGT